jgi:hypothetical protein
MESTIEALRQQIRREERGSGLRPDGVVSDEEIRRRRLQLGAIAALLFIGLAISTIANDLWTSFRQQPTVDPGVVRLASIALAIGFVAYALDKERHLKRLTSLGRNLHELDIELAERIVVRATLADAMKAVTASLDLETVLDTFLERAMQMVGADRGSIVLLAGGEMRPATTRNFGERGGTALLVDETLVLRAAMAGEPIFMTGSVPLDPVSIAGGPVTSVACVPFAVDGVALGALTVGAVVGDRFEDGDVELLREFAAHAALAVDHARRFESIAMLLDGVTDTVETSDRLHHLAAVIADAVSSLRVEQLDPRRRAVQLDLIGSSGSQLLKIADSLLSTGPS